MAQCECPNIAGHVYGDWLLAVWSVLFWGMSVNIEPPLEAFSMLRALILPKRVLGLALRATC